MWDSMLKVRAGQTQPTGGTQNLLRTSLRSALVYTHIKSRGGGGTEFPTRLLFTNNKFC